MLTDILEVVKRLARSFTVEHAICLVGMAFFAGWLVRTSLGRESLIASKPRRNSVPTYVPFIVLFVWFTFAFVIRSAAVAIFGELSGLKADFQDNIIQSINSLLIAVVTIILAGATFARRLKGFGLNPRTLLRDFAMAAVNLLTVWPVLLAMVVLTTLLGKLIYGPQFEMQQHAELQLITESSSVSLRVLICVLAVAVAPVVEELIFRGIVQTVIRSYVVRPWPAIIASSIVFAAAHENVEHWPALFVLAMCLGYAYERSGSLFRPIFIHALFNGVTIAAALSQQ